MLVSMSVEYEFENTHSIYSFNHFSTKLLSLHCV